MPNPLHNFYMTSPSIPTSCPQLPKIGRLIIIDWQKSIMNRKSNQPVLITDPSDTANIEPD
jgi:hypothetical protein